MDRVIPLRIVRQETRGWLQLTDKQLGALQFLGNLFEYFLVRKNKGKEGSGEFINVFQIVAVALASSKSGTRIDQQLDRHHLTVIGATSGDVISSLKT